MLIGKALEVALDFNPTSEDEAGDSHPSGEPLPSTPLQEPRRGSAAEQSCEERSRAASPAAGHRRRLQPGFGREGPPGPSRAPSSATSPSPRGGSSDASRAASGETDGGSARGAASAGSLRSRASPGRGCSAPASLAAERRRRGGSRGRARQRAIRARGALSKPPTPALPQGPRGLLRDRERRARRVPRGAPAGIGGGRGGGRPGEATPPGRAEVSRRALGPRGRPPACLPGPRRSPRRSLGGGARHSSDSPELPL